MSYSHMFKPKPATKVTNHLLSLPIEIQLNIMTNLDTIYTLKNLLDAFPQELYPIFRPYSRSVLGTIFWRPMYHGNHDKRGVVYRWMLRELRLESWYLDDEEEEEEEHQHRQGTSASATTTSKEEYVGGSGYRQGPIGEQRDIRRKENEVSTVIFVKHADRPVLCNGNDID